MFDGHGRIFAPNTQSPQLHPPIALVSSVTSPFRASARPSSCAPVVTVIEVNARIFPSKTEFVPRVAELPTCQKILQGDALLTRTTWLPLPVISVDEIWNMKTALGFP